jgi:hypothetical protein
MTAMRWAVVLGLSVGLLVMSSPIFAQGRDPDGTRMQARNVEVGDSYAGSLAPPEDRADWRMIRLGEAHALDLQLTVRTSGAEAKLTLTDSRGDELATSTAGSSAGRISQRVDAGIYYIAVESDDTLRYELAIR